ncbi:TetR/AcrR family transcriptional regulator [Actinomadura flavalba]|uniref:TetR/AcrR family transcriptional regulator n=1 Tax=Actinomadura flavalba TaxID=1120938 RepID=UPI0003608D50|nr:TetR/AcrR family transcriptional regulator [Actinomadura flavalba]
MTEDRPYHHGDLPRALLAGAAEIVAERGPAALSLRDLARRTGVSHAAPAHHFGDKTGLFTALATEGFTLLAAALGGPPSGLRDLGRRYVAFALDHPSHFAIMYRRDLVHTDDPALTAAKQDAYAPLRAAVGGDDEDAVLAAWSLAHGYATLALAGAVPGDAARFPDIARAAKSLGA